MPDEDLVELKCLFSVTNIWCYQHSAFSSVSYLKPQDRNKQPWEKRKLAFKKERKQLISGSGLPLLRPCLVVETSTHLTPHHGMCVGALDWHRLKVSQPEILGSNSLAVR